MQTREPKDIEGVLAAGIKAILSNLKFRVADFSTAYLVRDEPFRAILQRDFYASPGAKILLLAPDLFVIRPGVDPKKGVFFVKCFCIQDPKTSRVAASPELLQIYREFYPVERMLIVVAVPFSKATILAGWLDDLRWRKANGQVSASISSLVSFENFLSRTYKAKMDEESANLLNNELLKAMS